MLCRDCNKVAYPTKWIIEFEKGDDLSSEHSCEACGSALADFIRRSETMAIIFVTVQNAIAMCLWTQVRYFSVKHLYFLELGIGRM